MDQLSLQAVCPPKPHAVSSSTRSWLVAFRSAGAVLLAVLASSILARGQPVIFKDINMLAYGINDSGTIVGLSFSTAHPGQGVIYSSVSDTYTYVNYPNAAITVLIAINNAGDILGSYGSDIDRLTINKAVSFTDGQYFIYSQGTFRVISSSGAIPPSPGFDCGTESPPYTCSHFSIRKIDGLNDRGEVVGFGLIQNSDPTKPSKYQGFFGRPALGPVGSDQRPTNTGTYTRIDCPNNTFSTAAFGINNNSFITGVCTYSGPPITEPLFLYSGTYSTLSFTDSILNVGFGINDSGQVVGSYQSTDGSTYGLYYDGSSATSISHPDYTRTTLTGINNNGLIIGNYDLGGFVITVGTPLRVTTTNLPPATSAQSYGVTLAATGGSSGRTWSIASGILPAGFTLTSAGVLNSTGAIAAPPNTYNFTVKVIDSASNIATQKLSLVVSPAIKLPSAMQGRPYDSGQLPTSGSSGALNWALLSGTLPPDVTLLPGGKLTSSKITSDPGKYIFSVRVTDLDTSIFSDKDLALVILGAVTILDPVPISGISVGLLDGNKITDNRTALALIGRPVEGVAADGITQAVLRVPALDKNDLITVRIFGDQCHESSMCNPSNSSDDDGGLLNIGVAVGLRQSLPNLVTDTADAITSNAFVVYRAPIDFVRFGSSSDGALSTRNVYIELTYSSAGETYGSFTLPLPVVRPPVILIHGTFSDPSVFNNFAPLQPWNIATNTRFSVWTVAYDQNIDSRITEIYPNTHPSFWPIRRNVIGLSYNAPLILDDMANVIGDFKTAQIEPVSFPVAAVQADVVAHSLGGLMARAAARVGSDFTFQQSESFYGDETYGAGYIHKLITLGTPHLGTNLALRTVNGDKTPGDPRVGELFPDIGGNDCTRSAGAILGGTYSLNWVRINGRQFPGAAFDQLGDPTRGILSPTLSNLNRPRIPGIPTALIAGLLTPANSSPVVDLQGKVSQAVCGTIWIFDGVLTVGPPLCLDQSCVIVPGDFLADNYSSSGWPHIYNDRANDVVVPFTSATFNLILPPANIFAGVVHGPGSVGFLPNIGFNGPQLLDPLSGVPARVVALLNTIVTDSNNFYNLP